MFILYILLGFLLGKLLGFKSQGLPKYLHHNVNIKHSRGTKVIPRNAFYCTQLKTYMYWCNHVDYPMQVTLIPENYLEREQC